MKERGEQVTYRILADEEYLEQLRLKLIEEAQEVAFKDRHQTMKELADLQEVLDCLIYTLGHKREDIAKLQDEKNQKSGSFKKRIYVESTSLSDDNPWTEYLAEHPAQYPEQSTKR
jgi:predicted house-cleaning noncanonical NTP pyrophosphatase (MazG superfamily)